MAQSVGINDDNSTPDPSAMLDVHSTSKGMLVPRMTTAQRLAIDNPATGLLVFDSETNSYWFFNGTEWTEISRWSSDGGNVHRENGNVGIGTTHPNSPLEVAGIVHSTSDGFKFPDGTIQNTAAATADADADPTNELQLLGLNGNDLSITNGNTVNLNLYQNNWTADNGNVFRSTGKVGIGTSDPDGDLHIKSLLDENAKITLENNGTGNAMITSEGGQGDLILQSDSETNLKLDNGIGLRVYGSSTRSEIRLIRADVPAFNSFWAYNPTGFVDFGTSENDGLRFWTDNNIRFHIKPDGAVGIGTTMPSEKLEVAGTIYSNSGGFKFPDGTTQSTAALTNDADADPTNELVQSTHLNGTALEITDAGGIKSVDLSSLQDGVDDADNDPTNELQTLELIGTSLNISNGNSVELNSVQNYWSENNGDVYRNAGNVGIGTIPDHSLDIRRTEKRDAENEIAMLAANILSGSTHRGGLRITHFHSSSSVPGNLLSDWTTVKSNNAHLKLQSENGKIFMDGNVGIGTANPEASLHINQPAAGSGTGGKYGRVFIGSTANDHGSFPYNNIVIDTWPDWSSLILFNTGRYNSKWSMGFHPYAGTPGPGYHLDNDDFYIGRNSFYSSNRFFTIKPNGNIGIGTTNPGQRLEVSGNIQCTSLIETSDQRLKINILPLRNTLEKVQQIQGVYYNWNQENFPEKDFSDEIQIGFIAQELEPVYPELIHTNADGYKSVNYTKLTPILVEAIKEQQQQIDDLQSQLTAQSEQWEARYQSQQNRIQEMMTELATLKTLLEKDSKNPTPKSSSK